MGTTSSQTFPFDARYQAVKQSPCQVDCWRDDIEHLEAQIQRSNDLALIVQSLKGLKQKYHRPWIDFDAIGRWWNALETIHISYPTLNNDVLQQVFLITTLMYYGLSDANRIRFHKTGYSIATNPSLYVVLAYLRVAIDHRFSFEHPNFYELQERGFDLPSVSRFEHACEWLHFYQKVDGLAVVGETSHLYQQQQRQKQPSAFNTAVSMLQELVQCSSPTIFVSRPSYDPVHTELSRTLQSKRQEQRQMLYMLFQHLPNMPIVLLVLQHFVSPEVVAFLTSTTIN